MLEENEVSKEYKLVKISPEAHQRLKKIGTMDDSFDTVIIRILDFWEANHQKAI